MGQIDTFKTLFNLVCKAHQGPVVTDFGRQMVWDNIVAVQCNSTIQFIQTDGINAVHDVQSGRLNFSEGSPEALEHILLRQMDKMRDNGKLHG